MAAKSGARGSGSDGVGVSSRVGTVQGEFASRAALPKERAGRELLLLSFRSRYSTPEPGRWSRVARLLAGRPRGQLVTVFMNEDGDAQDTVGFWPEPPDSVLVNESARIRR